MFSIAPKRTLIVLLSVGFALFGLHLLGQWASAAWELSGVGQELVRVVNVSSEPSLPTWFSTLQLAAAAALLFAIAHVVRKTGRRFWAHWFALSFVFIYLSLDEQAQIHEIAVNPVKSLLGVTSGPLSSAWVIPFGLIVLVIGIIYLRFLIALPANIRWLVILAAVLFLGGSLGMEMVDAATGPWRAEVGAEGLRTVMHGIEELLEMAGVSVFIYALLRHGREITGDDVQSPGAEVPMPVDAARD